MERVREFPSARTEHRKALSASTRTAQLADAVGTALGSQSLISITSDDRTMLVIAG